MKFFLNLKIEKILFILISLLFNILQKIIYNSKSIKVCICSLAKLENKYIIEFIDYYLKFGVDKIFIYDNNDINGEKLDTILLKYIKQKVVKIINFRGLIAPQIKMLNDCYKKNNKKYDWFILFDIDEFIYLKDFTNIKLFLNQRKFKKCDYIYFNRAVQTDGDKIKYENKSLSKRFTKSINNVLSYKPILKGNIANLSIIHVHKLNYNLKFCDSFGKLNSKALIFKYNYIKHYYFKSTEEFIEKLNKGDSFYNNTDTIKFLKIKSYFESNKVTLEKINYIENKARISLSFFRKKYKNVLQNSKVKTK